MFLIKSAVLAAICSSAVVTAVSATEAQNPVQTKLTDPQNWIAQAYQPFRESRPYRNYIYNDRQMVDEMIINQMAMVNMAPEMLQSTRNPEVRRMAQEMIKKANEEMLTLVEMRRKLFLQNPDKN